MRNPGIPWVAPAIVVLSALSLYPLLFSLKVSLSGGHFTRLFQDRLFAVALWQTMLLTCGALLCEIVLGLMLAVLVDSLPRARGFFRAGLLVPMLLPPVVAAVVWRLIFNPQFGALNGTLRMLGIDTAGLTWTNGESSALASVILVDVWEWTPFVFLLVSAGLQGIPRDPIEAAIMDGAGAWRVFRDITLPLLKPVLALAALLRAMDLIRSFDQVFLLTQGGPGFATETASLYIYRTAFRFYNFGYAAAMSFALLLLTTLFARGFMKMVNR